MSKVSKKQQPEKVSNNQKMFFEENVGWKTFLWNPETKEFLGRGLVSWAKIMAFYIVFYAFLACFFAFMMTVLYHTLPDDRPKYTAYNGESVFKSPGLSMRPDIDRRIIYNPAEAKSYEEILSSIDKLIQKYNHIRTADQHYDCSVAIRQPCDFDVSVISILSEKAWGYSSSSPTVILKMNKIFDWKPRVYKQDSEKLPAELRDILNSTVYNVPEQEMVWVWCTGKNVNFTYVPLPGFPAYYFPFNNQRAFLAPMVAISIQNLPEEKEVRVKCKAYADNMEDVDIKFSFIREKTN